MTTVAAPCSPLAAQEASGGSRRQRVIAVAEFLAMALVVLVWDRWVARGAGGRDPGRLTWGLASLVPGLAATRAWRLPPRRLVLPVLVAVSALLVGVLAPFGWADGQAPAAWAYAAGLYVATTAFARTSHRRAAVAVAVALVALDQFATAFLPWWGSGHADHVMVGTFYWHNQFAAFLLPGVLVGSALAVFSGGSMRWVGWVSAPLCLAGIVYSTSRACLLLALVGIVLLAAIGIAAGDRRRRALRSGGLLAACVAAMFFFTSPVFFGHWTSPFAAEHSRSASESLGRNTGYRLDYWRAAVGDFADHPLAGGGWGSFGQASIAHLPVGMTTSPAAHNGMLQAFAEGGVVAGLPLTLAVLAAVGMVIRRLRAAWADLRRRRESAWIVLGVSAATLALLIHALVDFDWLYPALLASLAVCLGGFGTPAARPTRRPLGSTVLVAALIAVVGTGGLAARQYDGDSTFIQKATVALNTGRAAHLAGPAEHRYVGWAPDYHLPLLVLQASYSAGFDRPSAVPASAIRWALAGTADAATVDPDIEIKRAAATWALGQHRRALSLAETVARDSARTHPTITISYAELLAAAGQSPRAAEVVAAEASLVAQLAQSGPEAAELLLAELNQLHVTDTARTWRCAYGSYQRAFGPHPHPTTAPLAACRAYLASWPGR